MRNLTILIFACFATIHPIMAQEKELQEKTDAFMQQHKSDVYDLAEHAENQAFRPFFTNNAALYATVRRKRLEQFATPPAALTAMEWHAGADQENVLEMLSIIFTRSYEPTMPATFAYNILLPSVSDGMEYYKERKIFGALLYAKPLSDSSWQVWSADKVFAVSFVYNIRKGTLSALKYTQPKDPAYQKIQWTPSMVKPMDDAARLMGELTQLMWSRQTTLGSFYQQREARFKKVREGYLQPSVKAYTPAAGYREIIPAVPLAQDSMSREYFHPAQWEEAIQNTGIIGDSAMERAKRAQINNLIGSVRYVKQLDADNWEVWTLHDTDRIYYIWNTRKGTIDKPRYWLKQ